MYFDILINEEEELKPLQKYETQFILLVLKICLKVTVLPNNLKFKVYVREEN